DDARRRLRARNLPPRLPAAVRRAARRRRLFSVRLHLERFSRPAPVPHRSRHLHALGRPPVLSKPARRNAVALPDGRLRLDDAADRRLVFLLAEEFLAGAELFEERRRVVTFVRLELPALQRRGDGVDLGSLEIEPIALR